MNNADALPGQFNVATCPVDRHVAEGRTAMPAHVYEDRVLTYGDVQSLANRSRRARAALGVAMQDRVIMLCLDAVRVRLARSGAGVVGASGAPRGRDQALTAGRAASGGGVLERSSPPVVLRRAAGSSEAASGRSLISRWPRPSACSVW